MSLFKEPVQSHASAMPKALLNQRRAVHGTNHTQSTTIQLGDAASAHGCFGIAHSNLWYDPELNSLAFIHRNNPATYGNNTAFILYDFSTDGGNSWSTNQGPVYGDSSNLHRGRYPSGLLANPGLGSIATDGYVVTEGPSINTTNWFGRYYGVSNLGGATHAYHYDSLSYICWPENMFTVKYTGDIWKVGHMYSNDGNTTYLDSIIITHGTWNSSISDYDFTENHLYVPVNPDIGQPVDMDIAFDDFGTTGYIALITNNDPTYTVLPDSTLYIDIYGTADGGATWLGPVHLDIQTALDTFLLNDSAVKYGATFDLDVVVDANGNLHVLTGIAVSTGFSIYTGNGMLGMFDIYTNDHGLTWNAHLLNKPVTSRGTFGDPLVTTNPINNQDGRPFASRNSAGDKLFFSWFDSDTLVYGTSSDGHNNKWPDLHSVGYNVTTGLWTDTANLTRGGDADGLCTYGNGSYYVIDSASLGTVFSIPVVFQQLQDPLSTGLPTTFWYVKDANMHMSQATLPGTYHTVPINFFNLPSVPIPSVWPGDCNYDLTVDNYDFLFLYLANQDTGSVRIGATTNWVAQAATDWVNSFPSGLNHKHADTNGDGIANGNDTTAIYLNYGQTHPFRPANQDQVNAVGDFYLVPDHTTVSAGDTINYEIHIANTSTPISSLYGIAFSISFDQTLVDTTQVHFNYSSSVLGTINSDMKSFEKDLFSIGRIDAALSRIDHTDALNVGGILGTLTVVTSVNFSGSSHLIMTPANVKGIDVGGTQVTLHSIVDSVVILGMQSIPDAGGISLFPNPARNRFFVQSTNEEINLVELYDADGRKLYSSIPKAMKTEIPVDHFASGIYSVTVVTGKKVMHKKIQIAK